MIFVTDDEQVYITEGVAEKFQLSQEYADFDLKVINMLKMFLAFFKVFIDFLKYPFFFILGLDPSCKLTI